MAQKGGPSTAEQDFFRSISDVAKSVAAQGVEGCRQVAGDRVDRVPDTLVRGLPTLC